MDWNAIVVDLSPALLRYFSASYSRTMAADLVQEVFIRLVKKTQNGEFNSKLGSIRMFAFGIARFVRLEAINSNHNTTTYEQLDETTIISSISTVENFEKDEQTARLYAAINMLPLMQREVILLLLDKDISMQEIAVILQLPIGTVKSHIHRAKETLKNELGTKKG